MLAAVGRLEVKPAPTPAESKPVKPCNFQQYAQVVSRIHAIARQTLPRGATVLVVSKGDEQLTKLERQRCWHFPQHSSGCYAGHHPSDSAAAIAHLEALRAKGAQYLLFPATGFWWLDYYLEFKEHLDARYASIFHHEETCLIYRLGEGMQDGPRDADDETFAQLIEQIRSVVAAVLPADATVAVVSEGDDQLLNLGDAKAKHFPEATEGRYPGHLPADSAEAIAGLEASRRQGVQYLLLPRRSDWWLQHYADFARHLTQHYRTVVRQRYVCQIFSLQGRTAIPARKLAGKEVTEDAQDPLHLPQPSRRSPRRGRVVRA
jgi:hypothetical protein